MNVLATVTRIYANWTSSYDLSALDSARLDDLGLTRKDVFNARARIGSARGEHFSALRQARADAWLR